MPRQQQGQVRAWQLHLAGLGGVLLDRSYPQVHPASTMWMKFLKDCSRSISKPSTVYFSRCFAALFGSPVSYAWSQTADAPAWPSMSMQNVTMQPVDKEVKCPPCMRLQSAAHACAMNASCAFHVGERCFRTQVTIFMQSFKWQRPFGHERYVCCSRYLNGSFNVPNRRICHSGCGPTSQEAMTSIHGGKHAELQH